MPVSYNNISPKEAVALQAALREQVLPGPLNRDIKTIGGADISFNRYSEIVFAGVVVFSYPDMQVLETATAVTRITFPYVPGLLAFREVPAVMEAWSKLRARPDLLIMDGQGIAHPRRMGIACHFGLLQQIPTIGCAKSLLCGQYEEPANEQFAYSPLMDKSEQIGLALRTKRNCKPVFISPGHMVGVEDILQIIKTCTGKYRIPEPTRQAHLLVNQARIAYSASEPKTR